MSDESRKAYQLLEESDTDAITEMLEEHGAKSIGDDTNKEINLDKTSRQGKLPQRDN